MKFRNPIDSDPDASLHALCSLVYVNNIRYAQNLQRPVSACLRGSLSLSNKQAVGIIALESTSRHTDAHAHDKHTHTPLTQHDGKNLFRRETLPATIRTTLVYSLHLRSPLSKPSLLLSSTLPQKTRWTTSPKSNSAARS
jgi:hypothetical protein